MALSEEKIAKYSVLDSKYFSMQRSLLNGKGASIDMVYGPWDSKEEAKEFIEEYCNLTMIDGMTIAVKGSDGKITKYVWENSAWREEGIPSSAAGVLTAVQSHIASKSNPHGVTKEQVGLDKVDNTSDKEKPISSAVLTALKAKENSLTGSKYEAVTSGINTAKVSKYDAYEADINDLKEKVEDNKIMALNAQQASADAKTTANNSKSRVDALEQQIYNLPEGSTTMDAKVALNTSRLEVLQDNIGVIEEEIYGINTKTESISNASLDNTTEVIKVVSDGGEVLAQISRNGCDFKNLKNNGVDVPTSTGSIEQVSKDEAPDKTEAVIIGKSLTDKTIKISHKSVEVTGSLKVNGVNVSGGSKDFSGVTLVVFGDSAAAQSKCNWPAALAEEDLGVGTFKNFAEGGNTWRNNWTDETKTTFKNCLGKQIQAFEAWAGTTKVPDIILIQMGGNDIVMTGEKYVFGTPTSVDGNTTITVNGETQTLTAFGDIEQAFKYLNNKKYKESNTTVECMRYYLQYLREKYPSALIVVGTVLQRYTGKSNEIAEIVREVCRRLCIQVVDGEKYVGFSQYTEAKATPRYFDDPDQTKDPSRTYPVYNYINTSTGEVVSKDVATTDGVLNSGYSKKYGLYTIDGVHVNALGDKKIEKFMYSQIYNLYV